MVLRKKIQFSHCNIARAFSNLFLFKKNNCINIVQLVKLPSCTPSTFQTHRYFHISFWRTSILSLFVIFFYENKCKVMLLIWVRFIVLSCNDHAYKVPFSLVRGLSLCLCVSLLLIFFVQQMSIVNCDIFFRFCLNNQFIIFLYFYYISEVCVHLYVLLLYLFIFKNYQYNICII